MEKQIQPSEIQTIRENISDPKALFKQGFKVTTHVYRLPAPVGKILKRIYDEWSERTRFGFTVKQIEPQCCSMFVLRKAHQQNAEVQVRGVHDETDRKDALNTRRRDNYVYPFGGVTRIEVETPSGHKFTGVSRCCITDIFNRKTARELAVRALIKDMYTTAYPKKGQEETPSAPLCTPANV